MYDLISILLDYVEALPPTPDMDRVSEESFPFLQRLYQLTGSSVPARSGPDAQADAPGRPGPPRCTVR